MDRLNLLLHAGRVVGERRLKDGHPALVFRGAAGRVPPDAATLWMKLQIWSCIQRQKLAIHVDTSISLGELTFHFIYFCIKISGGNCYQYHLKSLVMNITLITK